MIPQQCLTFFQQGFAVREVMHSLAAPLGQFKLLALFSHLLTVHFERVNNVSNDLLIADELVLGTDGLCSRPLLKKRAATVPPGTPESACVGSSADAVSSR